MNDFWSGFILGELSGIVLGAAFMFVIAHRAILEAHQRATEAMPHE